MAGRRCWSRRIVRRGMRSFRFGMCIYYDVVAVLLVDLRKSFNGVNEGTRCQKPSNTMLFSMARRRMEGISGSSAGGGLSGRVRCFRRRRSSRSQNNDYHISIFGVSYTVILPIDYGIHASTLARFVPPTKAMKASAPKDSRHETFY